MQKNGVVFLNNSRETFTADRSGAIGTCIWELVRVASSRGFTPHVITRDGPGAAYPWQDVTLLHAPTPGSAFGSLVRRVRRRLDGWARPDQRAYAKQSLAVLRDLAAGLVIVNNDPEIAIFLQRKLPQTRVLHWFHNLETTGDRFKRLIMRESGLSLAAVSSYLARAIENVDELTPFRVTTVHNGVDAQRFRTSREYRSGKLPVLGFLGRIAVEKGVDTFLESCLILAARSNRFSVQVVGDTNWGYSQENPYSRRLNELVASLTSAGIHVHRTGHLSRAEVPAALSATDVHVVPSRWDDPLPLTVLEGMAAGCALVATAVGGIPEMVSDSGRLVERENPEALAAALEPLIQDSTLREELGQRALQRVQSFTWERTLDGLLSAGGLTT
ncbi:glycosyltransferase family 4 protein [Microbacterium horticulturae]|uniref:Glycosyltransferase family 4 protein n=1 Tax=Microbacterium horticulturae TaxID=3028316 RepID=A0ABY8BZ18_9MICO|nr:glycosyltransferase family 4 protein [Microbacterium sp. KACC 23027]WEG09185.1 glycosyltransferase family 4 protein [Microbacterium sp. KACC 23027]